MLHVVETCRLFPVPRAEFRVVMPHVVENIVELVKITPRVTESRRFHAVWFGRKSAKFRHRNNCGSRAGHSTAAGATEHQGADCRRFHEARRGHQSSSFSGPLSRLSKPSLPQGVEERVKVVKIIPRASGGSCSALCTAQGAAEHQGADCRRFHAGRGKKCRGSPDHSQRSVSRRVWSNRDSMLQCLRLFFGRSSRDMLSLPVSVRADLLLLCCFACLVSFSAQSWTVLLCGTIPSRSHQGLARVFELSEDSSLVHVQLTRAESQPERTMLTKRLRCEKTLQD